MPAHPIPLTAHPTRSAADGPPHADALSHSHTHQHHYQSGQPHDHGCVWLYQYPTLTQIRWPYTMGPNSRL